MLCIRDLRFNNGASASLNLQAGDMAFVSGPSGSGKTRLLRAIADLDDCSGEISLNGKGRDAYTPQAWRQAVMLIPVSPRWWAPTAAEHMIGDWQHMLDDLNLDKAVASRPVASLSSGEQQRLALIRGLCRGPEVLLLDEPTAQLDPENERAFEQLLQSVSREKAVLWISHDPDQIRRMGGQHWRMGQGGLQRETA